MKTAAALLPLLVAADLSRGASSAFVPAAAGAAAVSPRASATALSAAAAEVASPPPPERRAFLSTAAAGVAALATSGAATLGAPERAAASGGATAGKYTTIPIAKRRYYGRVQQAVHEFLLMGDEVVKGDMTAPIIRRFFDTEAVVVVEAKRRDIGGQCTKKDGDCRGKEIRDSRYNDMKTSMYLLGNAFRYNQVKAPDNLPTVRAAKAFFKEMDAMEKAVNSKRPKTNDPASVAHYATALDILDEYLDLVELPPMDSGHYDQEFDTLVGETARIT